MSIDIILLLYSSLLNTRPKTIYPRHALFFSFPSTGKRNNLKRTRSRTYLIKTAAGKGYYVHRYSYMREYSDTAIASIQDGW